MPDPADFANTPPTQRNAYGPGGGWADPQGSGYVFMANPQKDMADAQKRASDAAARVDSDVSAQKWFGKSGLFGRSDADVADSLRARDLTNQEVNRISDFQRRRKGQ